MDLKMMEGAGDREGKMEGYCSIGQSPQRAVVPVEEEEEELMETDLCCVDRRSCLATC
jgi:hypothetical protein